MVANLSSMVCVAVRLVDPGLVEPGLVDPWRVDPGLENVVVELEGGPGLDVGPVLVQGSP